jgi:hypothetical protein
MRFIGDVLRRFVRVGGLFTLHKGVTCGREQGLLARYGEASMLKSFKFMVNLVLIGIAIGRTYTLWQQRFTSVTHLR